MTSCIKYLKNNNCFQILSHSQIFHLKEQFRCKIMTRFGLPLGYNMWTISWTWRYIPHFLSGVYICFVHFFCNFSLFFFISIRFKRVLLINILLYSYVLILDLVKRYSVLFVSFCHFCSHTSMAASKESCSKAAFNWQRCIFCQKVYSNEKTSCPGEWCRGGLQNRCW